MDIIKDDWIFLLHDAVCQAVKDSKLSPNENDNQAAFTKLILDNLSKQDKFNSIKIPNVDYKKSSKISNELRIKGNNYFTSKNNFSLDRAIEEYTKSIAYAPAESTEISLAYANRSAALFKARLLSDCLLDIQRALDNNYPDYLKAKLYYRRALCLQVLNSPDDIQAKNSFDEAKKWTIKMSEKNRNFIDKILKVKEINNASIDKTIFTKWDLQNLQLKLKAENSMIPGLSNAVELQYNEKHGRHMVATRDIKPGEILGIQKAYASVLLGNIRYKVCWNCENQTWSSIPCYNCADVVYCSETCRDFGKLKHHDIECNIISQLFKLNMYTGLFLSLRLTVMAYKQSNESLELLKNNIDIIDRTNDPLTKGFTNKILEPENYASAYGLIHHSKLNPPEWKIFSIIIAYLFAIKSNIFNEKIINNFSNLKDDELFLFLIHLIEKNVEISDENCFSIYESKKIEKSWAIVPTFTFFNHSCIRMIVRTYINNKMIITSLYPIKKGEEIFETYVTQYDKLNKNERHKRLAKYYYFNCNCQACRNNWPIVNDINYDDDDVPSEIHDIKNRKIIIDNNLYFFGKKIHSIPDVRNDVEKIINIIENNCKYFEKNSVQVVYAVRLLEDLLKITNNRHLSLDY